MLKAKEYKIEDSNIAMLGSDLEKSVKRAAANTEPAWDNAGKELGIQIWRIEKFHVKSWPKNQYGQFFDGDSYIVLHTWKKPDGPKLFFDVYFWLGKFTTQDEAGTAAYKTVELDDKLGGDPVQHREVQGFESVGFLKLFNGHIRLLSGGVETGFHHVEPAAYKPRLLHIKGKAKKVRSTQVELACSSLNSGDCFILDHGLKIFIWQGKAAGVFEKSKAGELAQAIDDEREGKPVRIIIREGQNDEESAAFFGALSGSPADIKTAEQGGPDAEELLQGAKVLYRLSDASGKLEFTKVAGTSIDKFNSDDVMIFDAGHHVFAWIGKGANANEKKNALGYAQSYLTEHKRPAFIPISRVFQGGENEEFNHSL